MIIHFRAIYHDDQITSRSGGATTDDVAACFWDLPTIALFKVGTHALVSNTAGMDAILCIKYRDPLFNGLGCEIADKIAIELYHELDNRYLLLHIFTRKRLYGKDLKIRAPVIVYPELCVTFHYIDWCPRNMMTKHEWDLF